MRKLKFLFPVFIFLGIQSFAQIESMEESTVIFSDESEEFYKDYSVTPTKAERAPLYYEQRTLNPEFKDQYLGKEFDYDRVVTPPDVPDIPSFNIPVGLLQFLLYALVVLVILVILYYIFKNAGGFSFGHNRRKVMFETSVEEVFEDEENIENNDFRALIEKAKNENNFRLATRYYFLWVLQMMSDRKLIKWNKDKTNYDYYKELAQKPIQKDFSNNIYLYDYIWYGELKINAEDFEKAEKTFQQTLNKIK